MAITSLYKDYFQKSRIFVYPQLGIEKGVTATPIQTYMSWKNQYTIHEVKLVCVYHLRNDLEFRTFEKDRLINNKLFFDFKEIEDNKGVYVFDYINYSDDWNHILNGKYSKLSPSYKKAIEQFIGRRNPNYAHIESFLYPEKYYKMYSEMMDVKESLLKEVGELCSIIDFDKETLIADIKSLELKNKMS